MGETLNFTYELKFKVTWLQADEYQEHWIENKILLDQLQKVIENFMFEKKILIKRDYLKELKNSDEKK